MDFLDMDVLETLGTKSGNTLRRRGITTLREFVSELKYSGGYQPGRIPGQGFKHFGNLKINNLGRVGEEQIIRVLRLHGISLGETVGLFVICPKCGHSFHAVTFSSRKIDDKSE